MTSAPSSAERTAWLRPWARAAPVTSATLSASAPTSGLARGDEEAVDVVGAERRLVDVDAEVGQRVAHRVGHRGVGADGAALAPPLEPAPGRGGGGGEGADVGPRHLGGGRAQAGD